jgi:GxxExxY protein
MDPDHALTYRIIGCGIEVHRQLGPGLSESNYEEALCIELTAEGLTYLRQVGVPVLYKGQQIGEHRPDLVVENSVVVEIKSVERPTQLQQRGAAHRYREIENLTSVSPCLCVS